MATPAKRRREDGPPDCREKAEEDSESEGESDGDHEDEDEEEETEEEELHEVSDIPPPSPPLRRRCPDFGGHICPLSAPSRRLRGRFCALGARPPASPPASPGRWLSFPLQPLTRRTLA